jgi:hypothetical protein
MKTIRREDMINFDGRVIFYIVLLAKIRGRFLCMKE